MKAREILKELVEHDSSTQEGANSLLDKTKKFFEGYRLREFDFDGVKSFYASVDGDEKPELLLIGHVDTVDARGWKDFEPFRFTEKDGRAYGLGVYDMKAGVAAMLYLAGRFRNSKIAYLLVTDEEKGGFNGAGKIADIIKPQFAIALEPTNLSIEICAKGVLTLRIISKGLSAHSSTPEKGVNAIEKLSGYLAEMKKASFLTRKNDLLGSPTMSQTLISCDNQRANQVPDRCETILNIRYIPEVKTEDIVKEFRQKAAEYSDGRSEIIVEESEKLPYAHPVNCQKDNEYVKLLSEAIKENLGSVEFSGTPGASDCRFFSERNMAVTCFGPVGENMHAPNEWISLEDYEKYVRILENFISRLKSDN